MSQQLKLKLFNIASYKDFHFSDNHNDISGSYVVLQGFKKVYRGRSRHILIQMSNHTYTFIGSENVFF